MEDKTYKQVATDVGQFLSLVGNHVFTSEQIDKQFNIESRDAKRYRWQILEKFCDNKLLEKIATNKYRLVQKNLEEMNWQEADTQDVVRLKFPLDLQNIVKIYHRSIILIAGAPGAGKTAFLYQTILLNLNHPMGEYLFTNDMTLEEIKERMICSDIQIPIPPPFKVYDREGEFGDVIIPDGINYIDYLSIQSDFFTVGAEIDKIYDKLKSGVAIVGLQKKPGQNLGFGGVFSLQRPKLYITLDSEKTLSGYVHILKIEKARGRINRLVNPRDTEIRFKLVDGIKFIKV